MKKSLLTTTTKGLVRHGGSKDDRSESSSEKKIERMVKAIIDKKAEDKFDNTYQVLTATTQAWQFSGPLCNPTQGSADQTRTGDTVTPVRLQLRIQLISTVVAACVRIVLFRWKQSNVVPPVVGTVFDLVGGGLAALPAQQTHMLPFNDDFKDNCVPFYDETFPMGIYAGGTFCASPIQREFVLQFGRSHLKPLQFNAGSTNSTNAIYICWSTDAAVTQPTLAWVAKTWFQDF